MHRSAPKPPARKGGDLDQPWQAGDPIPVPEAIHRDGESAWVLWNELSGTPQPPFAPTAPMAPPAGMRAAFGGGESGWAATQPAQPPALPAARASQRPAATLEAAMLVARRNNRVCPRPARWAEFAALLPPRKTSRGQELPPAAITGAAWPMTPPLAKRLFLREQVEWAERAGVLEAAIGFLQSLREDEWLHMGED